MLAPKLQKRFYLPEYSSLILISVILGLSTALAVLIFRESFHIINYLISVTIGSEGLLGNGFAALGLNPQWSIIFTLSLAGVLVGFIVQRFIGHEKHHGVASIMEAVALTGGRLPYRKTFAKALASAISLGAGASVGPEDPSVQIGANLGSFFGDRLHMSEERMRLLVAAGSASAIATAFHAPIAGVFFALEVVLGEFSTRSIGVVVLSSVIASGLARYLTGDSLPIFGDLNYQLGSPAQLPFFLLLGIILAFVSSAAIRFIHWQNHWVRNNIKLPIPAMTGLTGAVVGIVGIFLPQILGPGEETMHAILSGHDAEYAIGFLIILGVAKFVMTAISQAGGFQGGAFAPVLFMGIMFGSAYGHFLNLFIPSSAVGSPQNYAIAGMAAALAGIVRAPITAILLVFELTDDYLLILPIMLTAIVCVIITDRIGPEGLYMQSLINHGLRLQRGRDIDLMQGITVREAMLDPAPCIDEKLSLAELRQAFLREHTRALCVVNHEGYLTGIVTLGDLQRAFEEAMKDEDTKVEKVHVGDIATKDVITADANDMLWTAIRSMGARDIGRVPVVESGGKVVGMLRRQDIMNAYNVAMIRKVQDQHYAEQVRLHNLTGAHVVEFDIRSGSDLIDKQIKDIHWPPEVVVASILRKGKLIVPHGDTKLILNDSVTIVADPDAEAILKRLFDG